MSCSEYIDFFYYLFIINNKLIVIITSSFITDYCKLLQKFVVVSDYLAMMHGL